MKKACQNKSDGLRLTYFNGNHFFIFIGNSVNLLIAGQTGTVRR